MRFLYLVLAVVLLFGLAIQVSATVLWTEGFESYNYVSGKTYGSIDKNNSGASNTQASNPWFGPGPPNGWVTKAMTNPAPLSETVNPHGGVAMLRGGQNGSGGWFNGADKDVDQVNIGYRFNGGSAFRNQFAVDWWFYDILGNTYPDDVNKGPGCFGDWAAVEYRSNAPTNSDYGSTGGSLNAAGAALGIGAYESATGYNKHVYQVQVQGATDSGVFGGGWFNTTVTRSKGWHHAGISVNASGVATFTIDGATVLTHATNATNGLNVFTAYTCQATPDTYNQSAYYDDITLQTIPEPGSFVALGTGLIALLGLRRRRK